MVSSGLPGWCKTRFTPAFGCSLHVRPPPCSTPCGVSGACREGPGPSISACRYPSSAAPAIPPSSYCPTNRITGIKRAQMVVAVAKGDSSWDRHQKGPPTRWFSFRLPATDYSGRGTECPLSTKTWILFRNTCLVSSVFWVNGGKNQDSTRSTMPFCTLLGARVAAIVGCPFKCISSFLADGIPSGFGWQAAQPHNVCYSVSWRAMRQKAGLRVTFWEQFPFQVEEPRVQKPTLPMPPFPASDAGVPQPWP